MVDLSKKIVFVHIPRTSGTSIEVAIHGQPTPDAFKHYKASMIKNLMEYYWGDFFKFTVVRNPFDRIISLYHSEHYRAINALTNKTLEYFLKLYRKYHPSHEYGFTQSDYINEEMDLIIKFEDRKAGLAELFAQTDVKVDGNVRERATARPAVPYQEFYTEETKSRVSELYQEDLERFDYAF